MLRRIGSVIGLVLLTVACGAGHAFQYPPGTRNGTAGYKGLLYAANASGGTASLLGFSIHPSMGGANDGALTALAGFPYDLPACSYIVADQTGVYLYAAAGTVTGFKLNAATGELSPLSTAAFTTGNTPDFLMTF